MSNNSEVLILANGRIVSNSSATEAPIDLFERRALLNQLPSVISISRRDFLSLASHAREASKNPLNLNLFRGGDQRRQGHLPERDSDLWSFLRVR
jgi:hypothetical protein